MSAQRLQALSGANEIRARRAEFKRKLKDGEARLEDVLGHPEWWIRNVPVHELLSWGPRVGSWRVSTVLRRAGVWPLRSVGGLTARERRVLCVELRGLEKR